ncbi:MAG: hypothetical protein PHH87_11555, partial [Desulfuromonas sp.]|nr:hypothetical protein [Desulfuromonas sp.]
HAVQKCSESDNEVPMVTQNAAGGDSQDALYLYYKLWRFVLDEMFPIENTFVEKLIVTNVNGFTATYSVNDLLPFQAEAGGLIDVDLYAGVQDTWQQRCELNNVPVPIPVTRAIPGAAINALTDSMADTQYFKNPISDKKLVIFGHTHKAKIVASQNLAGEKTLYANSGTWIDYKESLKNEITMHFLIITPQADDAASETKVVLYNFVNEVVTKMDEDSVRL